MKKSICLFISVLSLILTISCDKDDDENTGTQNQLIVNGQKTKMVTSAFYCVGPYVEESGFPEYEGNLIEVAIAGNGVTLGEEISGNGAFLMIYLFTNDLSELETGNYQYAMDEPYPTMTTWGFAYNLTYPAGDGDYDNGTGTVFVNKISDTEYSIKLLDFKNQSDQAVTLEYQGTFATHIVN